MVIFDGPEGLSRRDLVQHSVYIMRVSEQFASSRLAGKGG